MKWYISTQENNYLCGDVKYDEATAKEKRLLRSILVVVYAPAEVIVFLSADIPRNRLGASLPIVQSAPQ